MQKTILLSTAAALLIAGGASAQESKWNIGAGYTYFDASDVELDVINVRGGYDFTPYFGLEGELLVGLEDEDLSVAGVPATPLGSQPLTRSAKHHETSETASKLRSSITAL